MKTGTISLLALMALIGTITISGNPATPEIDAALLILLMFGGTMSLLLLRDTIQSSKDIKKKQQYLRDL